MHTTTKPDSNFKHGDKLPELTVDAMSSPVVVRTPNGVDSKIPRAPSSLPSTQQEPPNETSQATRTELATTRDTEIGNRIDRVVKILDKILQWERFSKASHSQFTNSKYKCFLCRKKFAYAGELKIHLSNHTTVQSKESKMCKNKSFPPKAQPAVNCNVPQDKKEGTMILLSSSGQAACVDRQSSSYQPSKLDDGAPNEIILNSTTSPDVECISDPLVNIKYNGCFSFESMYYHPNNLQQRQLAVQTQELRPYSSVVLLPEPNLCAYSQYTNNNDCQTKSFPLRPDSNVTQDDKHPGSTVEAKSPPAIVTTTASVDAQISRALPSFHPTPK